MIPKLSEETIRHHATAQSFDRGQVYYRSGSVYSLEQEMSTAGEAWTLAQTLREQGELEQALQIAWKKV